MSIRLTWFTLLALHALPPAVGWMRDFSSGVLCLFIIHLGLLAATFIPALSIWGANLRAFRADGRADGKEVCITIDDGPAADTGEILSILDEAGVRAVFFLIGKRVETNPSLAAEIIRRGHAIGNHTQSHPSGWFWAYGPESQRREIVSANRAIQAACGVEPRLFRAPVGFRNLFNAPVLRDLGMLHTGWTARGFDGADTDVPRILRRLMRDVRPGAILLLHQGKPHHALLLRCLLEELRNGGWKVVLPAELGGAGS
jgi:peptidoglycan-N-acetylglucosamine deacetylase